MSFPPFSVVPLSNQHVKAGFSSGSDILDRYFRERAGQDIKRNLAKCFVAVDNEHQRIAGFYTLSAAQIPLTKLPRPLAEKMPRYEAIPASRMGRLAIDSNYQGLGLGSALIADALRRSAGSPMAVYALLVDAKDDKAAAFYLNHGFIPCDGAPSTLFLPLDTLQKL